MVNKKHKQQYELQAEIVRTLLKFGQPKSASEIAKKLGYIQIINGKEYGSNAHVKRPIDALYTKKILHEAESPIKKSGRGPEKYYDIDYSIETINNLVELVEIEKFPLLISDLQTSERVISELIRDAPEIKNLKEKLMTNPKIFLLYVKQHEVVKELLLFSVDLSKSLLEVEDPIEFILVCLREYVEHNPSLLLDILGKHR